MIINVLCYIVIDIIIIIISGSSSGSSSSSSSNSSSGSIVMFNLHPLIRNPPNKKPPLGGNKYLLLSIDTEARLPPS